jgi:hypothetical protein
MKLKQSLILKSCGIFSLGIGKGSMRQAHYEMCRCFQELHQEIRGGRYMITSVDLKEAHEFWVLNGELSREEMEENIREYFKSDFDGYKKSNFPAHSFFRRYNAFTPRQEEIHRRSTYFCPTCGQQHPVSQQCKILMAI